MHFAICTQFCHGSKSQLSDNHLIPYPILTFGDGLILCGVLLVRSLGDKLLFRDDDRDDGSDPLSAILDSAILDCFLSAILDWSGLTEEVFRRDFLGRGMMGWEE